MLESIVNFRFCLLIGFHCLGGPGFSKCTVTDEHKYLNSELL